MIVESQGDLWDGGWVQGDLFEEDPPEEEEPQVEVTDEEE